MLTHPRRRRVLPVIAAGALVLAGVVAPATATEHIPDGAVEIDLVGINDFHGRIEATSSTPGAAMLAGAVDSFRAANPNTLFVSGGDNIGASTFTSFVADDVPTIDVLNEMGLDVSALGNHEFDRGRADLDDRVLDLVDFPYLAANVYDTASGEPAFEESWVTDVDGISVGFIGAVTEDLPTLVTPAGIASLEVRSVVDEVNRVATELSDGDPANGEADVLVLLVHEGPTSADVAAATDDSAFGQIITGLSDEVDAVFAGHTHLTHAHLIPVDGWADGLARPVVQSGQYGANLAHVTLVVDPVTGDVVDNAAQIVPVAGFTPDPDVQAIVDAAAAEADVLGSVSLGEITADILRARTTTGSENRGGESTLGNLVADVQLWATQDAGTEIAFMNPGGLRADLVYASGGAGDPDGNVTYREAANVQSFANTLVTMTLTGQQVVDVLEEQWQPEGASRPFLKLGVAGLTYTYDPEGAPGERITQVMVGTEPLDLTAQYTVVANSFLASGGDNFATLADGADPTDSGRVDLQAFVDYMVEFSPVSPDLTQRAVGVSLDVPDGGFLPGDEVTADLSSLLFSAGEDQGDPPQVVVSIAGTDVGTFAIDPTIIDGTDEVGRATVTFTVPAGTPEGDLEVVVTVPTTGTTASFMVPVGALPEAGCVVEYDANRMWPVWLHGEVTVSNTGTAPVEDWQLQWRFTQKERVRYADGADVRQRASMVTASGSGPTTTLEYGDSASFTFFGIAPQGVGEPTGFTLNGQECSVS